MNYISLNKQGVLNCVMAADNIAALASSPSGQFMDFANRASLARLANRWVDVLGPACSYGYFAVTREVMMDLSDNSGNIVLEFGTDEENVKRSKLMLVRATSLAPREANRHLDEDVFIVEIADKRYYGNHPWLQLDFDGQQMFNVPATSYGTNQFYDDTTDGSSANAPWDWQGMLDELWPAWLDGASPTIPDSVDANITNFIPVGFDFRSFTQYQAYNIVLGCLSCELAQDNDGTYYLVDNGEEDDDSVANDRLAGKWEDAIMEDIEWKEPTSSYYPKGVKVLFQKTSINSGSENVYTKAAGQWYADLMHAETQDATSADLTADQLSRTLNAYHQLYDDMPCWTDPYSGVIQNQTDITNRAAARRATFYKNLINENLRKHWVYSGVVPFTLCGTMGAISWVQQQSRGGAWTTQAWCHPRLQPQVTQGEIVPAILRPWSPWQWRAAPIYPPEIMLWKNEGLATSGSSTSTSDDEYNGHEIRYNPVTKQWVNGIYAKGVQTP